MGSKAFLLVLWLYCLVVGVYGMDGLWDGYGMEAVLVVIGVGCLVKGVYGTYG